MANIIPPDNKPANDNKPCPSRMRAVVTIPKDSPIMQVEIEVFSFLLDDWTAIAANDNEEPSK